MASMIRIPTEKQGQTGMGQGGWTCWEFERAIGEPVTISLRRAIPLDVDLHVVGTVDDGWALVDPASPDEAIMEARRWDPTFPTTDPITIAEAESAKNLHAVHEHPAPHCLSCGVGERTLGVHAGPLPDGRWATPLRFPEWSLVDGEVDEGLVWMAIDCASGWYTSDSGSNPGRGLTVQFAVQIDGPLDPNGDYALVAWHGDHLPDWDGRKRGAAAALFDRDGVCVARSASYWVRPRAEAS